MMEMRQPGQNPTIETRHDSHEQVLHNKQRRYAQIIEILREKGDLADLLCGKKP